MGQLIKEHIFFPLHNEQELNFLLKNQHLIDRSLTNSKFLTLTNMQFLMRYFH